VELKPPTAIPVKPDQLVLRLHQEGSLWNDVLRASAFGLFQPYKPDSVTVDLLAVEA
jgi:type VI secretion system protein ImpJ